MAIKTVIKRVCENVRGGEVVDAARTYHTATLEEAKECILAVQEQMTECASNWPNNRHFLYYEVKHYND